VPALVVTAPSVETLYLLYRNSLAGACDEFEAEITRDWRALERRMRRDGVELQARISRSLRKLRLRGGTLDARAVRSLQVQAACDRDIWRWMDKQRRALRLIPSQSGGRGTVEVMNRRWRFDRGAPRALIQASHRRALAAVKEAAGPLGRVYGAQGKRMARRFVQRAQAADGRFADGASRSWADNVIRALEQSAHQASMALVDATSGPTTEAAILRTAAKFSPPLGVLALSYLTHQRAAFRATIGEAGHAVEARHYLYYLPAGARAGAAPGGFGAGHYAAIRTEREWQSVERKRKRKRPGSYLFTTGLHVGDCGFLLPIPALMLGAARAVERRNRQRYIDSLARREDVRDAG